MKYNGVKTEKGKEDGERFKILMMTIRHIGQTAMII